MIVTGCIAGGVVWLLIELLYLFSTWYAKKHYGVYL